MPAAGADGLCDSAFGFGVGHLENPETEVGDGVAVGEPKPAFERKMGGHVRSSL